MHAMHAFSITVPLLVSRVAGGENLTWTKEHFSSHMKIRENRVKPSSWLYYIPSVPTSLWSYNTKKENHLFLEDVLDHARVGMRLCVNVGDDRDAWLFQVDGTQHDSQLYTVKTRPHKTGGIANTDSISKPTIHRTQRTSLAVAIVAST